MRLGEGFSLYIVARASGAQGDALVQILRETEGLCLGFIEARSLWSEGAEVLGEVERALACAPGLRAVLVVEGIDELRAHVPEFFRLLNQRRNVMTRATRAAVILPMEASTVQALRRQAPDTWSLRAADLRFEASMLDASALAPAPVASLFAREVEPSGLRLSRPRLPAGTRKLFGREQALARLDRSWEEREVKVLTLVAWGGVGKTALVNRWRNDLITRADAGEFELDAVFEWSFYSQGVREHGSASADGFIREALVFFGERALADSSSSQDDKGGRLAEVVGRRRALLILDGLEPLQRVDGTLREPGVTRLLEQLARRNRGLCVVTSRVWPLELERCSEVAAPRWDLAQLDEVAGAGLLKSLLEEGERPRPLSSTQDERAQISRAVQGHALTLQLLGRYIREVLGDVRRWTEVELRRADDATQGGHAFRVMGAYVRWLEGAGEEGARQLAVLRLLGLFDRGADPGCMAALLAEPAIAGVSEALVGLDEQDWARVIVGLEKRWLVRRDAYVPVEVLGYDEEAARTSGLRGIAVGEPQAWSGAVAHGEVLDVHPLVREYFNRELKQANPAGWREGHRRLYEHLRDSVPYWPEGVEGLQPLYQAVVHGCAAGRVQEACDAVYRNRISRGARGYGVKQLGAFSADLGALSCFFERAWDRPSTALGGAGRSWVLGRAAFALRGLGRLGEALEPMRAGLEMRVELEDWENASAVAGNLSELELTLGRVRAAVDDAQLAVEHAERSGDEFMRIAMRTTLADARHQADEHAAARELFEEAESMEARQHPSSPELSSLQGHRYCDLLLSPAERAAWGGSWGEGQHLELCAEVSARVRRALAVARRHRWVLAAALDQLTLGRAALYAVSLREEPPTVASAPAAELSVECAREQLEAAVAGLRDSGHQDHLPRGLLTRAWLYHLEGNPDHAHADLDEAMAIAERGPMPLFQADIHLHRARLFHDREALADARELILRHGYNRRLPELEAAEQAAPTWPTPPASQPPDTDTITQAKPARTATTTTPREHPPDLAILVALPEEFQTLAEDYADAWEARPNPTFPGSDFFFEGPGGYRCVATLMPRMGPTPAAEATLRLLAHHPATLVNVGIAGGLKSGDLRIGDVIVPRQVDAYDETGKIEGQRWQLRGSDFRPCPTLLADILELSFRPDARAPYQAWFDAGRQQLEALRQGPDQSRVDALLTTGLLREAPKISTAHLASGSFVIASQPFARFIRKANADVHAAEMEAGGMMAAAEYRRERIDTLVVRGISDHVDADKSEVDAIGEGGLRKLAMDNAWRLLCLLMELGRLPRAS